MDNLTVYGDDELSLLVFNDEELYKIRHDNDLIDILDQIYTYNADQLKVLQESLVEDREDA